MTGPGDRYVEHSLRTSMFFPGSRLFVAGNPKAAGTTLRWWLLQEHGVDVEARTARSWWGESAPFQVVWDDRVDLTFTWDRLSDRQRRDALDSPDVLSVLPVRHPVTRLFSAWSGKYLIEEPYYAERLPPGFPELPPRVDSPEQLRDTFGEFVEALHATVTERGFESVDVHFWPQHRLLARPVAGPALELRQESMGAGLEILAEHLRSHGLAPSPPPRINETVVPYHAELAGGRTCSLAAELYADDFERWGYSPEPPPSSRRPLDLAWLADVRGRNRRYGVLHRELHRVNGEAGRLEEEASRLRAREQELLQSRSWRVTRPLRWVGDRTRR